MTVGRSLTAGESFETAIHLQIPGMRGALTGELTRTPVRPVESATIWS
jgi:hypothetical protein